MNGDFLDISAKIRSRKSTGKLDVEKPKLVASTREMRVEMQSS